MKVIIDDSLFELRDNQYDKMNVFELSSEQRNNYYSLYSFYTEMFIKYLIKYTKIKQYDNNISRSNLNFKKLDLEDKDFYQTLSDELNYYYLRNNLHLYRLKKEEIFFLNERLNNNNYELDSVMEEFIKNSFKNVMFENIDNNYGDICYGPMNDRFFVSGDTIVFGVHFDESCLNEIPEEKYFDVVDAQNEFLKNNSIELLENLNEVLGCKNFVIRYNEYCVKKKTRGVRY